jgi:hypothetical protein
MKLPIPMLAFLEAIGESLLQFGVFDYHKSYGMNSGWEGGMEGAQSQ